MRQIGDLGTPNLVLAGQAGDVGAGAADPPALDDGSAPAQFCHMPSQQLTPESTADDQHLEPFGLRHASLHLQKLSGSLRAPMNVGTEYSDNHHHFAAGLTSLHDAMRFVDLLEAEHAGGLGLELACSDLLRDFLQRHVR